MNGVQPRFAGTYVFKSKDGSGTLFKENPNVAAAFARAAETAPLFSVKNGVAVMADAKTGDITLFTKKRSSDEKPFDELLRDKGVLGMIALMIEQARDSREDEDIEKSNTRSKSDRREREPNLPELLAINGLFSKVKADSTLDYPQAQLSIDYEADYKKLIP